MAALTRPSHSSAGGMAMILSLAKKYSLFALRRWWLILPLIFAGVGAGYWVNLNRPVSYTSFARMMMNGRIAIPEGAIYSEEVSNFYGTQIELMQSAEIRRKAAADVETMHPEFRSGPTQLTVGQQRNTSLFALSLSGDDPQYCQALLDAIMNEYKQKKSNQRIDSADTTGVALEQQFVKLDQAVREDEAKLVESEANDRVVLLEEEANSTGRRLIALRQKLAEMQSEADLLGMLDVDQNIERDRQQKKSPEGKSIDTDDPPVGLQGPEADYLRARQQIQVLQSKVERFGRFLRPQHPKMIRFAEEMAQQQRLIELYKEENIANTKTHMASINLEIRNLNHEIAEWEKKTLDLSARIAAHNGLKYKIERDKSLADKLHASYENINVNKNLGQDVIDILEHASPAVVSSSGLIKNLTTGGAAGLFIGLGIVMLLCAFDDRISSLAELQHHVHEDVLGQIPREPLSGSSLLFEIGKTNPMFAQACKNLRSSLLYMTFADQRPKTLLITSSIPGEGKSTIAASLAYTLAAAGSRTLLVDADLRKGSIHDFAGIAQKPGLVEVLRREIPIRDAISPCPQPNLFVLPRGGNCSDASELFLGEATNEFLRAVYHDFDYVIIDSAPVLAKEDTASLAPKIDATLFVIRAGVTSARACLSALDVLQRRNVNLLGVIFNGVDRSSRGYYYYNSYGDLAIEDQPPVQSAAKQSTNLSAS
jgi:succinoglycan biosynthesis transport protein ExoP